MLQARHYHVRCLAQKISGLQGFAGFCCMMISSVDFYCLGDVKSLHLYTSELPRDGYFVDLGETFLLEKTWSNAYRITISSNKMWKVIWCKAACMKERISSSSKPIRCQLFHAICEPLSGTSCCKASASFMQMVFWRTSQCTLKCIEHFCRIKK